MKSKKNIVLLVIAGLLLFAFPSVAFAYTSVYDDLDDSYYHYFRRTVTKWDTVDMYGFVKQVPKEGPASYWILIQMGEFHRTKPTAEIAIDQKSYTLQANNALDTKYTKFVFAKTTLAVYDIPDEVIDSIKTCKTPISFVISFTDRNAITWNLDEEQTRQIKELINAGRALKK